MNFTKRAIISIKRRPGKTLILLLSVVVLGSITSGALAIQTAIRNAEGNLRQGMRPIVSFDINEQAFNEEIAAGGEHARIELMNVDMVREIGALPYVSFYDYSFISAIGTSELLEYGGGGSILFPGEDEMPWGWFIIRGASIAEPLDMQEGLIEITAGNTFSPTDLAVTDRVFPAMISVDVADLNNLSIDSVFSITNTVYRPIMDGNWERERTDEDIFAQMTFEFQVIGLFEVAVTPDAEPTDPHLNWEQEEQIRQLKNRIHVPNAAAEVIQRFELDTQIALSAAYWDEPNMFDENPQMIQTVMILNDIDDLMDFRLAADEILPHIWEVIDLSRAHSSMSAAMLTLADIAHWILIVSIGATMSILSLLIILFLKDRRHELGTYLALGEKRSKILLQILLETLTVAVFGITIALFIGHTLSAGITNDMLRNQVLLQTENSPQHQNLETGFNAIAEMGLYETLTVDDMMAAFDVSLNLATVRLFYVIGLGTVIASVGIPMGYLISLKPKKIMM